MNTKPEMPIYQCHKIVRALKITEISKMANGYVLSFEAPFPSIEVYPEFFARAVAQAGDYYVIYADGYASWSPGQTFEDGYSRVT